MSTSKWAIRDGGEEWEVYVGDGRVIITQCAAPFGLPVSKISLKPGSAGSVAKAIVQARNSTKPKRRSSTSTAEQS